MSTIWFENYCHDKYQLPCNERSVQLLWQWRYGTWSIQTQCPQHPSGYVLKFLQRWEFKILQNRASARYSKWTLPIHLGTPALSNIHPHHLIQLTTIAPFYIHVSKTYSCWSWGMNYSLSGPLFELLSYHDVKVCVAQWSQELCCWGHLLLVGSSKANWSWVRDQGPQV